MIGLVLCGGKSSRMNVDKGLQKLNQHIWATKIGSLIQSFSINVYYSVNEEQTKTYAAVIDKASLITDNLKHDIKGPSLGIFSTHLFYPTEDLLVVACDMPFMQENVIKELIASYQTYKNFDAWLFKNSEEPEPLCAIYSSKCLSYLLQVHQTKGFEKYSMKYLLEQITPFYLPITQPMQKAFRNFNTPLDLNNL